MIENIATGDFFSQFFQNKIRNRLYGIKEFYMSNPSLEQSRYVTKSFLQRSKLEMSWCETAVTNPHVRGLALQSLTLLLVLLILILRPF
jgi:hypothetical protein